MPVNLSDFFPFNQSGAFYENLRFEHFTFNGTATTWNSSRTFCWVVPSGVTSVRFEIWGGGGGGGAACCCAGGQPGGSGAYAFKWVRTTPGTVYCANIAGLCHPISNQSNIGHCGERTFVIGSGLSNFCVEGGTPGITNCNCHFSGSESACCDYQICNWSGANIPRFYGADSGACGLNGWWQVSCCGVGATNICGYKQMIPYPGGLINRRGGWFASVECADAQGVANNCIGLLGQWGGYPNTCNNAIPGAGGLSGRACAGACCSGAWGRPGALRVSYS